MGSQAFVFIGEDFYPRKHFEDLYTTVPYAPDLTQLALIAQQRAAQIDADGESYGTGWASVLVVHDNAPPEQRFFEFETETTKEALTKAGYSEVFSVREYGEMCWKGVKEVVRDEQDTACYVAPWKHTYEPK